MAIYISLVMKAAVIAIAAAAYFGSSVSGQGGGGNGAPDFCGCGAAKDKKNFPGQLGKVLDDLVKGTPREAPDVVSGDIIFSTERGAAAATGTCFSGEIDNCGKCLSELRGHLKRCGEFACGGVRFNDRCRMQFRQIK